MRFWSLAGVAVILWSAAASAEEAATPESAAKGRKGLCLVVGSGADADKLIIDIASNSAMLVHAAASDDASVDRIRKAIERANLAGQATVEKLPFNPLPFVNGIANLVVVDDPAKISEEEAMRVAAPFATLFTRKTGGWASATKPMPADMDTWPQVHKDAGLNGVSNDKPLAFGLGHTMGLRWLEGVPVDAAGCSGCLAWVAAGGRVYTYGVNERENLPSQATAKNMPQYVSARDAFNGLPLWKVPTGTTDDGLSIGWTSEAPLVADETRAWAGTMDGIFCLDGATGRTLQTLKTTSRPCRLGLIDGVLIASCWQERTRVGFLWTPKEGAGTVDAFDAKTGEKKWSFPGAGFRVAAAGDTVYVQDAPVSAAKGADGKGGIVAVDLATGKERWRKTRAELGGDTTLDLGVAGKGFVTVTALKDRKGFTYVLSSAGGDTLWKAPSRFALFTPVVDGLVWIDGKRAEALTGAAKGSYGGILYQNAVCRSIEPLIPPFYGFGGLSIDGKPAPTRAPGNRGFRTACGEGFVPAYGMVYIPQNYCKCIPGQVYGLMAMGATAEWPDEKDFASPRPVEKGPAFGAYVAHPPSGAVASSDWPTYRANAERSSSTSSEAPAKLDKIWESTLVKLDGPLASAWSAQLTSPLTPPVVAGNTLLIATTDGGQIFALDAAKGTKLWTRALPSRVDSPPTIAGNLAVVGCHDGWCYALRLADGELAWRTRVAPVERRMVAWGKVESSWPVTGSALVKDGTAYVTAGRTSDYEGGVALVALDLATGETRWARSVSDALRINDLLTMTPEGLRWHQCRFDPKDGHQTAPDKPEELKTYGGGAGFVDAGILDCTWTMSLNRRAHGAYVRGKVHADMAAWNAEAFVWNQEARSAGDEILWRTGWTNGREVEACVIGGTKVLLAGAETRAKPERFFLSLRALKDGERLLEIPLDARPTLNGVAVAGGKVYVSLYDGRLLCLGQGDGK